MLVISGDIRPDSAFALAERLFGGWARPPAPLPAPPAVRAAPSGASAVLVNVPDMAGATLAVAQPGVGLGDPDYFRALVASTILGGGYTSRLSRQLRVNRPLAEELRTWVDARRGGGLLYATAATDSAASAPEIASALAGGLGDLARGGMAADSELVLRRGFIVAQLAREVETVEGLANRVGAMAARGVGPDRLNRTVQELQEVDAADVRRFAGAHAAGTRVVVVGDARLMQAELRRRFPDLVVIYSGELDLGSVDLRRKPGGE
ncbi:MAG TPA: insulinase family protein [Longimicrobiaceae bacterium]|nr:insulinase family protein [Longimicrobiaceae bacterium]